MDRRRRGFCRIWHSATVLFSLGLLHGALAADDLKTTSGRVYKDATIIRLDATALVVQHRFGVVRIPFSEITAESRQKFNAQRAREVLRQRRSQDQKSSGDKVRITTDQVQQERAALQRATAEFEEQDQNDAEQMQEKIRRPKNDAHENPVSPPRLRLRGEVIGLVAPDLALVLCEPDDGVSPSYIRRELARLPDSPFAPPKPAETEVIAVTGLHQAVSEGQSLDIAVAPAGTRREFHTRSGENYSGRYRVFRAVD